MTTVQYETYAPVLLSIAFDGLDRVMDNGILDKGLFHATSAIGSLG